MTDTKPLRIFMVVNDLTHRKLAKRLGISKGYVDDILKSRTPAHHIRARLKAEFGFPDELIAYQDHRDSEPLGDQLKSASQFGTAAQPPPPSPISTPSAKTTSRPTSSSRFRPAHSA